MKSQKKSWCFIVFCTMINIWLSGCVKSKFSAPISNLSINNDKNNYNDTNVVLKKYKSKLIQSQNRINNNQNIDSIGSFVNKKIIYNRSYDNIHKGSYLGETYQVKYGDTLFYIAWITGNNYLDLARKNNIIEPYNLSIGQTLQVSHKEKSMLGRHVPNGTSASYISENINNINSLIKTPKSDIALIKSVVSHNNNDSKNLMLNSYHTNKSFTSNNNQTYSNIRNKIRKIATSKIAKADWSWPAYGKIIENFSTVEGGNKGIDISGFRGQSIFAATKGKIVYAGNALRGYGNLIIIKHNDDYLSAYAHNDTILVQKAQEVKTGQQIATMGSTGTNINKLHFEIRYKGKSVDPLYYLPR